MVFAHVWREFSNEAKGKAIEGILRVFMKLRIMLTETIEIVINEVPMENWVVANQQASERFKEVEVP